MPTLPTLRITPLSSPAHPTCPQHSPTTPRFKRPKPSSVLPCYCPGSNPIYRDSIPYVLDGTYLIFRPTFLDVRLQFSYCQRPFWLDTDPFFSSFSLSIPLPSPILSSISRNANTSIHHPYLSISVKTETSQCKNEIDDQLSPIIVFGAKLQGSWGTER